MLHTLDFAIIGLYLAACVIAGVVSSLGRGAESFAVNSRSTGLPLLVLSVITTSVGAGFFLSVAAEAYSTGISFGLSIALVTSVSSLVLAAIAPKIKGIADQQGAVTVPQLLGTRYRSSRLARVAAVIVVVGYLFVTALQFVGLSSVAKLMWQGQLGKVLLVAGVTTLIYTVIGGIRANIYADIASFIVTTVALVVIVPMVLWERGGQLLNLPGSFLDPLKFGGPPFLLLSVLLSAVSAFVFLEMWQLIFSAESVAVARKALVLSAVIQPLFVACAVVLGLVAAMMFPGIDKNIALLRVFSEVLPTGLLGLGVAGITAILMDTVNTLVLVGGTILYVDILPATIRQSPVVGGVWGMRLATLLFGALALVLAFVFPDLVNLLLMGAFVLLPLSPAIAYALFSKDPSEPAAFWSVVLGTLVTLALVHKMPQTAFGPGLLVSLVVLAGWTYLEGKVSKA